MIEVRVPRLNSNDTHYVVVEWVAEEGARVAEGDPLVVVETSKATEEIAAEGEGVVRRLLPEGAEIEPGQTVAHLLPGPEPLAGLEDLRQDAAPGHQPQDEGVAITEPARALMASAGVSEERVRALGVRLVRRADIERLAARPEAPEPPAPPYPRHERVTLGRAQRRTAELVAESHRTVPAAFTALTVEVDAALAMARAATRSYRTLVGLPELLVRAAGLLRDRFPLFFAEAEPDGVVRLAPAAHVGVTFDTGKGLAVPVVRDAGTRSLAEVSRDLMEFRRASMGDGFRERDLRDPSTVVTLHTDPGVAFAVPIVFPGHTSALSLPAVRTELELDGDGAPVARQVVNLGVAYDHRVLNGRDAVAFLVAARELLRSPEQLA
ncbi:2-oxo acid dehydrogenase subunit E2 [Nonomuraea dietziae]|uniref:2-oxo acid dehydrogenase subunit E2 n=1 Tax=Nonomuraea dietziae TaxID=65515 RepID=UPI0033C24E1B